MIEETYFDAVLDKNMRPVFNGTPAETRSWISKRLAVHDNADVKTLQVCVGKTLAVLTIDKYMTMAR